jgi:pSer/pThr/pTyr-binding forkhead associated (FHA) protein
MISSNSGPELYEAQLEVLAGGLREKQIALTPETLHFGRALDNNIVLDDPMVSRYHAHLTYEEGRFYLIDLNTPNGTSINKKKILNQRLQHGDVIQIGNSVFRFLLKKSAETRVTPFIQKGTPQKERITPEEPPFGKRHGLKKLFPLFLGGFGLLFLIWLAWPKSEPLPLKKEEKAKAPITERYALPPDTHKEAFLINKEKADGFYNSGYREYMAKNYLRALDDFKAALELYPDHRLAQIYLDKTEAAVTEEIEKNYTSALSYFKSGQYHLSIHHFRRVMTLLSKRAPSERYCEERQDRQNGRTVAAQNRDYERYCDSKQKIEEALKYLSSHGF